MTIILIVLGLGSVVMITWVNHQAQQKTFYKQDVFPGLPTPSQEAEAQVARARKYQHQVKMLVAKHRKSAFAGQLREMTAEFDRWGDHLGRLVKRLTDFENNALLQQDLDDVPKAIQQVKAQIEVEGNPAVRRQLEDTLTQHREHQKQLESLTTLMRRTQLKINGTVTAMATIYSQLQLLAAMDIDSGQAQRLSHEIEEEVLRMNDLLTAVDELSQLHSLPTNLAFIPISG